MIRRLLVANRAEIASRVFRTCRALGIETVAVHSDADAGAPVRRARPTPPCGCRATRRPTPTSTSTRSCTRPSGRRRRDPPGLRLPLRERRRSHAPSSTPASPGSGPTPESIEAMGSKIEAKRIMREAGVPVLEVPDQPTGGRPAPAREGVRRWRWPRHADRARPAEDSHAEVEQASAEAASAFGDGTVFVEPYVERGRHVEVQVVGDRTATSWCSASATARSSAATRRSSRRRRPPTSTAEVARRDARRRARRRRGDRLRRRRHGRVPLRPRAGAVLLPRDEHPAPGRAPGHRGGVPASTWSSCSWPSPKAAPRERLAHPGTRGAGGPRDRGAALRRGPVARLPAAEREAVPVRGTRSATASGSRRGSCPARRCRPTTTRCSPR